MNTTIAVKASGAMAVFEPPTLSPSVERAVREYLDHEAHGNLGRFGVPALAGHLHGRAVGYLAEVEAEAAPAALTAVLAWLAPVAGSVAQAPSQGDFETRAAAVQMACLDIPGWAFNSATSLAAVRKFQWFPSAAEVRTLLGEETREHRATIRALKAIVKAAPAASTDQGATPMAPEQRNALACGLRALVEEQQAKARLSDPGPMARREVRPHHLRPDMAAAVRDANPIVQAARAAKAGT